MQEPPRNGRFNKPSKVTPNIEYNTDLKVAENGNLNEKIIISETVLSLAPPSSVDTDMLSSLGVRMKEFPDPLAGWEDLEPELQARRRASHAQDLNIILSL